MGRDNETAMSDETSKSGHDDILSSVRKIVSTELKAAADGASGKLLLTPALRVEPNEGAADNPSAARDFPTLEERIADLEEAVSSDSNEWEPDGSEDLDQHIPERVVLPLRRDAQEAPVEYAPADQVESDVIAAVSEAMDEAVEAEAERADQTAPTPAAEPREPVAPPLAQFKHKPMAPEETGRDHLFQDDATLMDEGGLRDLVAEIVREELQGGLGERITRNVRKLVRAEIQRAFAARDLD